MILAAGGDPARMSSSALAFVGDAVYGLLVRESLAAGGAPAGTLHGASVRRVNASAQAAAARVLLPALTEEELAVFRRGRNAHTAHAPRSATRAEYHAATGLEALFGYLYLKNEAERLRALFALIERADSGNANP